MIDKVGIYYQWFFVNPNILSYYHVKKEIDIEIMKSSWIKIYLRKKALPEIVEYINHVLYSEYEQRPDCAYQMIDLIQKIKYVYDQMETNDVIFQFAKQNLVVNEDETS